MQIFFNTLKMLLQYFAMLYYSYALAEIYCARLCLKNGKESVCVCMRAGRVAMTVWLRPACTRIYEKINPSGHKATLLPHFNTLSFSDMGGCIILIGSLD